MTAPSLPSAVVAGVRVRSARGDERVGRRELAAAVAALRELPRADLRLLARAGVSIRLHGVAGLEDGILGGTTITRTRERGDLRPTLVRVATRSGRTGSESIGEILQHEVGHAVAVLRSQDTTEESAHAYARRH